jgi:hypothetical protein
VISSPSPEAEKQDLLLGRLGKSGGRKKMAETRNIITKFNEKYANLWSNFLYYINERTQSTDNYITLEEIEYKFNNLNKGSQNLDDEILSEILSSLDERHLIKQIKNFYKTRSIILRTNTKFNITIQTVKSRITITRYMLSPLTQHDRDLLWEFEKKRNIYPLDRYLNIENLPFRLSVDAMLKVSNVGQNARSFKDAAEQLSENCGIKLDPVTICSVTKFIGNIAFNTEMNAANCLYHDLEHGNITFNNNKSKTGICYIQVDGAMVNTREKGEDGSGWREYKLGLIYSSDNVRISRRVYKNGKYEFRHRILKKSYTSYIGEAAIFKKLLFNCAMQNQYNLYNDIVLIGDGAKWIKTIKDEVFPDAIQILDFYHLSEKIWSFSKIIFKNVEKKYKPWSEKQCDNLREGKFNKVIDEIIKLEIKNKIENEKISPYMIDNKNNIDYALYLKKGYIIGSGAIESSNKGVLQSRLKQSGMKWHVETAQAVVTLRAKKESGRWFEDVVVPVKRFFDNKIYCR